MTQVFLETLTSLGSSWHLVERRFSTSIAEVGKFRPKKLLASVSLLARLFLAQRKYKPIASILFITNRPASFIVDWAITEILRLFKQPLVNYIHTNGFSDLAARNLVFKFLVKRALGYAEQTVCLSVTLQEDVAWAVRGALCTIPNTPYRIPIKQPNMRSPRPSFLFLSNLIPEKGVGIFVDAAILVAATVPSAKFIIAGDSPDPATVDLLRSKIQSSGYEEQISILGKADEETKWRLLDEAHALVFPSTYPFEAQPLTIVEAMSRGVPVIAFDTGGIRDLIADGLTGYLIKSTESTSLVAPMQRIAVESEVTKKLGNRAAERFEESFSRSAYERSWAQVLNADY